MQRNEPATLRTTVGKQRYEELELTVENMVVSRLPEEGNTWGQLDAEVTETDDSYVLEWETPGFSYFAIASQPNEQTPTPSDGDEEQPDTDDGPSDDDGPGVGLIGFVVLVLLVAVAGAVYYFT